MLFMFTCFGHLRVLHSFPTRRSSDLSVRRRERKSRPGGRGGGPRRASSISRWPNGRAGSSYSGTWPSRASPRDRKSTRLNSSHSQISYAVFCLKKKNNKKVVDNGNTG